MVNLRPRHAGAVEYRAWNPRWWLLMVVVAALIGIAIGTTVGMATGSGPAGKQEYKLWRWEADTAVHTAFSILGIGSTTDDAGSEALIEYFRLTSDLRAALEAADPDVALVDALANERSAYENDVERVLERYLTEAIGSAGLKERLPLFRGVSITWPPAGLELTSPPRLLVISPRDAIRRDSDTLLKNDLSLGQIEAIERRADSDRQVSIVVAVGGIAAYPAIVRDDRAYDSILETSAHEWVHHYLAFYPLGLQWSKGGAGHTLNETTANIAGREIANLVHRAHPVDLPAGADGRAPAGPAPTVNFSEELRKLRLEVDALLAEGKVDEAERTMEERRLFLADNGINIRKINQAYFAFYGTYADSPASSDPIGPKIERVWELTGDVGQFLRMMREVTSEADLDRLLDVLESAATGE